MKKILIECRAFAAEGSSVAVYLSGLLQELVKSDQKIILLINNKNYLGKFTGPNVTEIYSSVSNNIIWDNFVVPYFAYKEKANVVFYPKSSSCWFPLFGKKIIVTIHGMIYKINPECEPWYINWYWRLVGKIASIVADNIIAVSQSDKKDLLTEDYPEKKFSIIPIGVNSSFSAQYPSSQTSDFLGQYSLVPKRYWLQIGNIMLKKNQSFTIDLLSSRLLSHPDEKLVFVGSTSFDQKYYFFLQDKIKNLNLTSQIIFLGVIDQIRYSAALPILLQNCLSNFFPSTYEGFGMPAIETMAAGAPLLVSDRGSLPEVLGKNLTLPLEEPKLWQDKIQKIVSDPNFCQQLITDQKNTASGYSWSNIAQKYLELFKS